jgi:hypothetical protein
MKPNIVIVGYGAARDKDAIRWGFPQTEYWGFNELFNYLRVTRFDRWFEIHSRAYLKRVNGPVWDTNLTTLRGMRIPIYMQRKWKDIPYSRAYPKREVEALTRHGDYHMGSFDWMVAYAILRGAERIDLYGVDLGPTNATEPLSARACLEYWLGVAEGRGIDCIVHGGALFCWYQYMKKRDAQYGWDTSLRIVDDKTVYPKYGDVPVGA